MKILYRYETPGQFDQLPYGTEIIRVSNTFHGRATLFKQISKDSAHPIWEEIELLNNGGDCSSYIPSDRGIMESSNEALT